MSNGTPRVVRYRWDSYGAYRQPTGWLGLYVSRTGENGHFKRACRALALPSERIRFELENGQQCVVRLRR